MDLFNEFNKLRIKFISEDFVNANKLSEALENKQIRDPLADYFSKYFTVLKEKKDDTNKYRFDLILYHKSDLENNYPVIIECKRDGRKRGVDLANWCLQCKIYSSLFFKGKKVSVFCYPQISHFYLIEGALISPHTPEDYVSNINSFIYASFNIGELLKIKKKNFLYVLCVNNSIVWSSQFPETFNYNKLSKLFNL
jgi:hypothetical protein